jgi:hypothetical protein
MRCLDAGKPYLDQVDPVPEGTQFKTGAAPGEVVQLGYRICCVGV